jgi:hypothetical protein
MRAFSTASTDKFLATFLLDLKLLLLAVRVTTMCTAIWPKMNEELLWGDKPMMIIP